MISLIRILRDKFIANTLTGIGSEFGDNDPLIIPSIQKYDTIGKPNSIEIGIIKPRMFYSNSISTSYISKIGIVITTVTRACTWG